ncbi:MAG: dolichol kinase [Salinigranum sp.]
MSELERRLVHASGTVFPLAYVVGLVSWRQLGYVYVAGSAVAVVLEVVRLFVGLEWTIFDRLTREYEQDNPAGYALYVFSQTAVVLVFPPYVAVPGMLMLTVGDPISGLLGSNDVGQVKRITTLVVMFAACFLLAAPFLLSRAAGTTVAGGVLASAAGAAGATVADGVKPIVAGYVVDDNLSIPPVACLAIEAVLLALR